MKEMHSASIPQLPRAAVMADTPTIRALVAAGGVVVWVTPPTPAWRPCTPATSSVHILTPGGDTLRGCGALAEGMTVTVGPFLRPLRYAVVWPQGTLVASMQLGWVGVPAEASEPDALRVLYLNTVEEVVHVMRADDSCACLVCASLPSGAAAAAGRAGSIALALRLSDTARTRFTALMRALGHLARDGAFAARLATLQRPLPADDALVAPATLGVVGEMLSDYAVAAQQAPSLPLWTFARWARTLTLGSGVRSLDTLFTNSRRLRVLLHTLADAPLRERWMGVLAATVDFRRSTWGVLDTLAAAAGYSGWDVSEPPAEFICPLCHDEGRIGIARRTLRAWSADAACVGAKRARSVGGGEEEGKAADEFVLPIVPASCAVGGDVRQRCWLCRCLKCAARVDFLGQRHCAGVGRP